MATTTGGVPQGGCLGCVCVSIHGGVCPGVCVSGEGVSRGVCVGGCPGCVQGEMCVQRGCVLGACGRHPLDQETDIPQTQRQPPPPRTQRQTTPPTPDPEADTLCEQND